MRRFLWAPLLAGVLVAATSCAAATQTVVYGSNGPDEPLDARLYGPMGGRLQFAVSRAAYVAIFEVAPGRGMSMVFPSGSFQSQRRFISGTHSLYTPGFSPDRSLYRYVGLDGYYEPTFLVLIASERPLRVQRMLRTPSALLAELGFATFYSTANIHAVYRLAEHIVPDPERTEWTYDTYVIWPNPNGGAVMAYRVVCADGRTRIVTAGFVPAECLDRRGRGQPAPGDTVGRDSVEFPSPIPRVRPPSSKPPPGGATAAGREGSIEWPRRTQPVGGDRPSRGGEGKSARSGSSAEGRSGAVSRPPPERGRGREGAARVAAPRPEPPRQPTASPRADPSRESRPAASEGKRSELPSKNGS